MQNGHGDVVELRDETGTTRLNRYSYDIWGNPVIEEEMIHNPFRYSGELWDETTSLQYLRARWYDPSDGRFISEDSYKGQIDNPLSLNLYTYVGNNPLTRRDPSGHDWKDKLSGFLDAVADELTLGGYSYVIGHGTDIPSLEITALEKGIAVTNGKPWVVYKFDRIIGAKDGKETSYIRVEISPDGTVHSHPITDKEYKKLTKKKD